MIQYNITALDQGYLFKAHGFGKSFERVMDHQPGAKTRQRAEAQITYNRIKGMVEARDTAYRAVGHHNRQKLQAIADLRRFLTTIRHTPCKIFRVVLAHEDKLQLIMKAKPDKMDQDLQEIIKLAHSKVQSNG